MLFLLLFPVSKIVSTIDLLNHLFCEAPPPMKSGATQKEQPEDESSTLKRTYINQFDECLSKIDVLRNNIPSYLEQSTRFQNASANLSKVLIQMKQQIITIQAQSAEALSPILPLYQLRTKVSTSRIIPYSLFLLISLRCHPQSVFFNNLKDGSNF